MFETRAGDVVTARVPMYFGAPDRALFGWYHPPARASATGAAVVICPPLGHEYMNAHRSLRHLADRLAGAGVAALRFDYHGTGDSAGHAEEPGRLAAWTASVHDAIRALRAESGSQRVGLVGLRMGAMLAAVTACELDVSCLVLWAPCVRGRTFLREVRALDLMTRVDPAAAGNSAEFESGGLLATDELQREVAGLDLESLTPRAGRVLIAARDDMPEGPGLAETWRSAGLAVDRHVLPGYLDMVVAPHNTAIPHAAIADIVAWVAASIATGTYPMRPVSGTRQRALLDPLVRSGVRESVMRLNGHGTFGVLSEPVGPIDPTAPAVVLSNAGSAHHVGPNRLYVDLARSLAHEGFRCLRLDLPGLGDSVLKDAARENVPYVPEASAVIATALDALSQHCGASSFVLAGLCSGAHTSFHAALDLKERPIVESVLINPLTFAYTPGMSLDAPSEPHATRWQRYRRSAGSLRGWSKLFRTDIDVRTMVRDVWTRAGIARRHWLGAMGVGRNGSGDAGGPASLDVRIRRLADRRTQLTLVFSRFDPGYDLLMINARRTVTAMRGTNQVSLWFIEGANHTFDARGPRGDLIASLTGFLTARYLRR